MVQSNVFVFMCFDFVSFKAFLPQDYKKNSPIFAYNIFIVLLWCLLFHSIWNLLWVMHSSTPKSGVHPHHSPDIALGKVSRDLCVAESKRQFCDLVLCNFSAACVEVEHTSYCEHVPLLGSGTASFPSFPSISLAFLCLLYWIIFFPISNSWYFSRFSSELSSLCPPWGPKLYIL